MTVPAFLVTLRFLPRYDSRGVFTHRFGPKKNMDDIPSILDAIRHTPDCTIRPPCGLPSLPEGVSLPPDVRAFYELAGGALLFSAHVCAGHVRILNPDEFQRIDLAITGEQFERGPFSNWFAIADVRDGNYIAIDLDTEHFGLCYDAFHETFAMPGYVNVIASSFSDLLRRLLNHKEDSTYWLQEGFVSLGEAFALYGYNSIAKPGRTEPNDSRSRGVE